MTFYPIQEEYALRALEATPGELIRVRIGSRPAGRYAYVEWDRATVETYIRAAASLAWDSYEPQGYHLQVYTPAYRFYWFALNRPPYETDPTGGEPAATEPAQEAEPA